MENEKIRKGLLEIMYNRKALLENPNFGELKVDDAIAWLEKQGEQKPIIDGILTATNYDKMFQNCKVHKFKVGDWIAYGELNGGRIVNIVDDKYEIEFIDGSNGFTDIDFIDGVFHLWTIQDAKEGDVLCSYDNNEPSCIFIFEKYDDDYAYYYYHCGVNKYSFFLTKASSSTDYIYSPEKKVYPASSIQHKILYDKMKENHCIWDDTAKKLKREKVIYFCVDEESESMHIIRFKDNINDVNICFTYKDTEDALKRGNEVIITTSLAHFSFDLIAEGYDIYLCYQGKEVKIEPHMDLSGIGEPGKDLRFGHNIFKMFRAGVFNQLLGVKND